MMAAENVAPPQTQCAEAVAEALPVAVAVKSDEKKSRRVAEHASKGAAKYSASCKKDRLLSDKALPEEMQLEDWKELAKYTEQMANNKWKFNKVTELQEILQKRPFLAQAVAAGRAPAAPEAELTKEATRKSENNKRANNEREEAAKRAKKKNELEAREQERLLERLHEVMDNRQIQITKAEVFSLAALAFKQMHVLLQAGENLELAQRYQEFIGEVNENKIEKLWPSPARPFSPPPKD